MTITDVFFFKYLYGIGIIYCICSSGLKLINFYYMMIVKWWHFICHWWISVSIFSTRQSSVMFSQIGAIVYTPRQILLKSVHKFISMPIIWVVVNIDFIINSMHVARIIKNGFWDYYAHTCCIYNYICVSMHSDSCSSPLNSASLGQCYKSHFP